MLTVALNRVLGVLLASLALSIPAFAAPPKDREGQLTVAVAVTDLEPIVRAVGGSQVETVNLFKGCILRKDLQVEPAAKARLAASAGIVWTGFLNESAAITAALRGGGGPVPKWIDVSKGAARTNLPTSTCSGYVDPAYAAGDPFFWLNPTNGGLMARTIARGLGELRPASRVLFMANAEAFEKSLTRDIARWKAALKPVQGMRVFAAQCGWQNFSTMGGPAFLTCKGTPDEPPSPQALLLHVRAMKTELILVDPNTPQDYIEAFREHSKVKVLEVPSSIEGIRGANTYSALFENLVKVLLGQAKH